VSPILHSGKGVYQEKFAPPYSEKVLKKVTCAAYLGANFSCREKGKWEKKAYTSCTKKNEHLGEGVAAYYTDIGLGGPKKKKGIVSIRRKKLPPRKGRRWRRAARERRSDVQSCRKRKRGELNEESSSSRDRRTRKEKKRKC